MNTFQKYIPSPFVIAVFLSLLTLVLALVFTDNPTEASHLSFLLRSWESGIWSNDLLVFGYQMMLILVLGHILMLSRPMERLSELLAGQAKSTVSAVVLVSVCTMLMSFFNWGLGLIFGAVMARRIGEVALRKEIPINYPLVGASGYIGFMVWHAGLSGSAPLKVAEAGHLTALMQGALPPETLQQLPEFIPSAQTIFSFSNLLLFGVLLVIVPLSLSLIAKRTAAKPPPFSKTFAYTRDEGIPEENNILERSKFPALLFGSVLLLTFFVQYAGQLRQFVLTPNMLNFFMFGLGILLHGSFSSYGRALLEAIGGASGILIQFPLYFGIMGVMRDSGMAAALSQGLMSIANETTLPVCTFFSAGLVNIFVPSGGGQWAVQGPIVIDAALQLGVPLNKMVMALAYGDQITNMLQPFWALPLLAITKLKAGEILPYTVLLMLVGSLIYVAGLLVLW